MKRLLLVLFAVLGLFTGVSCSSSDDSDQKILMSSLLKKDFAFECSGRKFSSLQTAVDAVSKLDGDESVEIKLLKNFYDAGAVIGSSAKIVFNLNGFRYYIAGTDNNSGEVHGIIVKDNAELTLASDCDEIGLGLSFGENYFLTIKDNATVNINGYCGLDVPALADMSGNAKLNINVGEDNSCRGKLKQDDSSIVTVNSGTLDLIERNVTIIDESYNDQCLCKKDNGEIIFEYNDLWLNGVSWSWSDIIGGMSEETKALTVAEVNGFNTNTEMSSRIKKYDKNLCGKNWMSYISDTQLVCNMSLPGSHDSCTFNIATKSGYIDNPKRVYGTTQTLNLHQQFTSGVRVFDLRPMYDLRIFHGTADCRMKLNEAIENLLKCLAENPDEGIIVILNKESGDIDKYAGNLIKWLYDFYKNDMPEKLNLEQIVPFVPFSSNLTMGQLRGKISIIFRDEISDSFREKKLKQQPYNGSITMGSIFNSSFSNLVERSFGNFKPRTTSPGRDEGWVKEYVTTDVGGNTLKYFVQDDCEDTRQKSKSDRMEMLLKYSNDFDTYKNELFINHTSGFANKTGPSMSYPKNAAFSNKYMADTLTSKKGRLGFVMMDFAGKTSYEGSSVYGYPLVSYVWQHNFYQDNKKHYWTYFCEIEWL